MPNVGQDVVLGPVHEGCELRHLGPHLIGDGAPLEAGGLGGVLGEGGGDEGGDRYNPPAATPIPSSINRPGKDEAARAAFAPVTGVFVLI